MLLWQRSARASLMTACLERSGVPGSEAVLLGGGLGTGTAAEVDRAFLRQQAASSGSYTPRLCSMQPLAGSREAA